MSFLCAGGFCGGNVCEQGPSQGPVGGPHRGPLPGAQPGAHLSHPPPHQEKGKNRGPTRDQWGVPTQPFARSPAKSSSPFTRLNGLNVTDKKYLRDGRWKKLPKYCRYCTSKKPRNRRRCCCSSINQFFILHRAITTRRTKEWTRHGIRREHSPGQFHI